MKDLYYTSVLGYSSANSQAENNIQVEGKLTKIELYTLA